MPTKTGGKKTKAAAKAPGKAAKGRPEPVRAGKAKGKGKAESSEPNPSSLKNQIIPYIIGLAALIIGICVFSNTLMGYLGQGVRFVLFGLFSGGAFAVPFLILNQALFWKKDVAERAVRNKTLFALVCVTFLSVLIYIFTQESPDYDFYAFFDEGMLLSGGGALGGSVGWALWKLTGKVGAVIISVAVIGIFSPFLFGLTPHGVKIYLAYSFHEFMARRRARHALVAEAEERAKIKAAVPPQSELVPAVGDNGRAVRTSPLPPELKIQSKGREQSPAEVEGDAPGPVFGSYDENGMPVDNGSADDGVPPFDIDQAPGTEVGEIRPDEAGNAASDDKSEKGDKIKPEKVLRAIRKKSGADDYSEIFEDGSGEDGPLSEELIRRLTSARESGGAGAANLSSAPSEASLEVKRAPAVGDKLPAKLKGEEEARQYVFPPASLLAQGTPPANVDISEELKSTAKRLVDTLASFKVRTRIVDVSRGPTITRYELAPEEGIRVRQIVNLVDDISLNLATSGVRIEAPIPGKQAVGIEVPNRVVATVYLREMIENPKFAAQTSRIAVSLGEDVAGEPVYVDIAKMPHLLIAGATGMGKSVCLNSMIVSLLYKSAPQEVKLILVDPKKVELNVYNGLPHLLVPVVSDPKKAAGSLQWAVSEMERRFGLIEEVGMRDLRGYNNITKDDPEKEFLPQIVIIIDELAELMMTAPDDVEESICRLAQKARAAGMHLIVGTQRPSVDVITGLIKANIPSRIAFTVASQVDSRTIIDIAGAEKLIGRGDMLYAPVGAQKPIRVQGAYVSENEIEAIVGFIKNRHGVGEYDASVIESIEREAARCGQSKKGSSSELADGDTELDPMLKPAIELAVESGKISTSLIQRRLQLGYGRAAKLIDRMERMGIVSPPDGQKPRSVLITRQQYMEMVLNRDEIE